MKQCALRGFASQHQPALCWFVNLLLLLLRVCSPGPAADADGAPGDGRRRPHARQRQQNRLEGATPPAASFLHSSLLFTSSRAALMHSPGSSWSHPPPPLSSPRPPHSCLSSTRRFSGSSSSTTTAPWSRGASSPGTATPSPCAGPHPPPPWPLPLPSYSSCFLEKEQRRRLEQNSPRRPPNTHDRSPAAACAAAQCPQVVALRQTKWWYMKRFLHPDVVAPYDYVFLWDEDIGVEGFSPERRASARSSAEHVSSLLHAVPTQDLVFSFSPPCFVEQDENGSVPWRLIEVPASCPRLMAIAREENLQIFQPAVDAGGVSWPITRKVDGLKLHRTSRDAKCRKGPDGKGIDQQPPCGNHIEIMARRRRPPQRLLLLLPLPCSASPMLIVRDAPRRRSPCSPARRGRASGTSSRRTSSTAGGSTSPGAAPALRRRAQMDPPRAIVRREKELGASSFHQAHALDRPLAPPAGTAALRSGAWR